MQIAGSCLAAVLFGGYRKLFWFPACFLDNSIIVQTNQQSTGSIGQRTALGNGDLWG